MVYIGMRLGTWEFGENFITFYFRVTPLRHSLFRIINRGFLDLEAMRYGMILACKTTTCDIFG